MYKSLGSIKAILELFKGKLLVDVSKNGRVENSKTPFFHKSKTLLVWMVIITFKELCNPEPVLLLCKLSLRLWRQDPYGRRFIFELLMRRVGTHSELGEKFLISHLGLTTRSRTRGNKASKDRLVKHVSQSTYAIHQHNCEIVVVPEEISMEL